MKKKEVLCSRCGRETWTHTWADTTKVMDSIEVIIRDGSGRKGERWIIDINDKKRARQIMRTIKESYGVDFGISVRSDLDWLKQN